MNSQGQLVHAKRQDGIDDVSIGYIRNTGGNSVGIEATTQVTDQWGEQRAEFNGSTEADWSITMDGETLSYNGVLTSSVTVFPLTIRQNDLGSFLCDGSGQILRLEDGFNQKFVLSQYEGDEGKAYEPVTNLNIEEVFASWGVRDINAAREAGIYTWEMSGLVVTWNDGSGKLQPNI